MPFFGLPPDLETRLKQEFGSTGIVFGGELSINAEDNTKFDLSAGLGYTLDQTVEPPRLKVVTWPKSTAVTVTNLATQAATDVAINADAEIVQQLSYTDQQLRSLIFIGGLDHRGNTQINNVFGIQVPVPNVGTSLAELCRAIGDIKRFGNTVLPAATDLTIKKIEGSTFSFGRNNVENPEAPHVLVQPEETPVNFSYVVDNTSGGASFLGFTTNINPDIYDGGAGVTAVVPNNRWTVQRVVMFSNTGNVFIQLGKNVYKKIEDAIDGIIADGFRDLAGIRTALTIGYIILKKGVTDLTSDDAKFIETDKFGTGLSGAAEAVSVDWGQIGGTLSDQTDLQTALDAKVSDTVQRTGTVIAFDAQAQYGTPAAPETGNITYNATGAKLGTVQVIYHNHSTAPTVPADWVLMDNSRYIVDTLNVIFARQSNSNRVEYWITQAAVV